MKRNLLQRDYYTTIAQANKPKKSAKYIKRAQFFSNVCRSLKVMDSSQLGKEKF